MAHEALIASLEIQAGTQQVVNLSTVQAREIVKLLRHHANCEISFPPYTPEVGHAGHTGVKDFCLDCLE